VSELVIAVQNVTKAFRHVTALDDISVDIERGETFALVGPNGAGKTTLIRIILDMMRPDSGSVQVMGRQISGAERARIGYLPEERGLYARRKVSSMLEYFGELRQLSRADARRNASEWLARLGLAEHRDKQVGELSKGNQQKVQLAATLLAHPEIVILDEPFSGLDPVSVRLVTSVLRELREAGTTIILSSHQMTVVEALCQRVMMVNRGRRVLYGSIDSVRLEHSANAVLVRAEGDLTQMRGVLSVIPVEAGSQVFLDDGVRPAEFLRMLVESGVEVQAFEVASSHLDDIFVKLVQSAGVLPELTAVNLERGRSVHSSINGANPQ
jgi:ABC-2 type transport system ATP-binding protein